MSASKKVKQLLVEREWTIKELAEKLNTSPQNLSNKLFRDTFTYKEYVKIADILGCDVMTITRDTKKMF